ncbi:MAG TPA: cupredoxin domain-containing protein [bacterium]|nr:cupredoxin domain-containing protein [bacterium]
MGRLTIAGALTLVLLLGLGAAAPAQQVQTIKMSMVSFKFIPDVVTLHEGQRVVLQLLNDDPQPRAHSVASMFWSTVSYTVTGPAKQGVTPDGNKYILLDAGQKAEVTFVPAARGQWSTFCSVFNHAARGETGAIVVWPAGFHPTNP